jgi:hypothetical protein
MSNDQGSVGRSVSRMVHWDELAQMGVVDCAAVKKVMGRGSKTVFRWGKLRPGIVGRGQQAS